MEKTFAEQSNPELIVGEIERLENSIRHLIRSNEELKQGENLNKWVSIVPQLSC